MENATTAKNPKSAKNTTNRMHLSTPLTYLDDLEEHAGPGGDDDDWMARSVCCGGKLSIVWQRKTGHLVVCCHNCRVNLMRFALARRPLAARAGAAIDGREAEG
jgi:hypothetical protein